MLAPEPMADLLLLKILLFEMIEFDLNRLIALLEKELLRRLCLMMQLSMGILQSSILIALPYSKISLFNREPSLRSSNLRPRNLSAVSCAVIFAESGGLTISRPLISIKAEDANFMVALTSIFTVSVDEITIVSLIKYSPEENVTLPAEFETRLSRFQITPTPGVE